MALEEFEREPLNERQRGISQMRTITNYGMGTLLIVAGFFFMIPTRYTENFLQLYDPVLIKIFGCLCWLYGGFRIYRGYKKNYFID